MRRTIIIRILFFIALIILYLSLTLAIPPDASVLTRYNLRPPQLAMLRLSVSVPLVIIWLIALYGFICIYRYANSIRTHKDGKAFMTISNGLGVLTFGLPIQSISTAYFNYLGRSTPHLEATTTIISNYIGLGIILLGFYILNKGAKKLNGQVRADTTGSPLRLWKMLLAMFSALYIYLVLHNPARSHPTQTVSRAAYYLPDWLILSTIVLPYIFVWYLGAQSAYYIYLYQKRVPGKLYRQALRLIAGGIVGVVIASMLVRFMASQTTYLNSVGLRAIFAIIYILLISISVGYLFVAAGARKLHKMENV